MNNQKIVTFGEIMLRLTPPDYLRFNPVSYTHLTLPTT